MFARSQYRTRSDIFLERWALEIFLAILFLGYLISAQAWEINYGFLFAIAGFLMVLSPPRARLPTIWYALGGATIVFSLLGFVPMADSQVPDWRRKLVELGLEAGGLHFVQPRLVGETLAVRVITVIVGFWILSQRVSKERVRHLAAAFVTTISIYAILSWFGGSLSQDGGNHYGFFPNRNHSAVLLALASIVGFGLLLQAQSERNLRTLILALVCFGVCLWALLVWSISRSGLLLAVVGTVLVITSVGRRHLNRNALMTIGLIGIASIGGFAIGQSELKVRLFESLNYFTDRTLPLTSESLTPAAPAIDQSFDLRIPIWIDTLDMIAAAPLVGVGAGQYAAVFPQFRERSMVNNDADVTHPESDWLWVASESGVPAVLCLLSLTLIVALTGWRAARAGRSRAVRISCWAAGTCFALQSFIDIGGHRAPLAWTAAWLFALALSGKHLTEAAKAQVWWRVMGALVLGAGIWLLVPNVRGSYVLATTLPNQVHSSIADFYQMDLMAKANAQKNGVEYDPDVETDPLMKALVVIDDSLEILPFQKDFYHLRGLASLHFEDLSQETDKAFVIERGLDPTWVEGPLRQAAAWLPIDSDRALLLWKEALRRAKVLEGRDPATRWTVDYVLRAIRASAEKSTQLSKKLAQAPDQW